MAGVYSTLSCGRNQQPRQHARNAAAPRQQTTSALLAALSLLAISLLALSTSIANAALTSCGDMAIPEVNPLTGVATAMTGPLLLTPGAAPYDFLINNSTDQIEFYIQSAPGVGDGTSYTRKLKMALGEPYVTSYDTVVASGKNAACYMSWDRFDFSSIPATVSVHTGTALNSSLATGAASSCYFDHKYAFNWTTFRTAAVGNCGFNQTLNTTAEQSYMRYDGRIFLWWEDYANMSTSTPAAQNATFYYDVTFQVPAEVNYSSPDVSNVEIPYRGDFLVSAITYTKDSAGVVQASIAFQLSTNWPYYPYFANSPKDLVANSGLYAGLALDSFPSYVWADSYPTGQDGLHKPDGTTLCSQYGDVCSMNGVLTYTWKPTPGSTPSSCTIASSTAYQFDFMLGCLPNNGTQSSCDVPLRDATNLAQMGSFKFSGEIDFCKAAATDFPLTWSKNFDVEKQTRQIGETIIATGSFTTNKKLTAVAIKDFRVSRSDLTGFWSLWKGADSTATGDASTGTREPVGDNTQFAKSITPSDSGKAWAISTSFTPNIKLYSGVQGSFGTTAARQDYLISLPNDKGLTLAFQITLLLRLYADSTQTFARRRRLLFRDAQVQDIKSAVAVDDFQVQSKPVSISVPENIQVSKDGSVTVVKAPTSGMSTGLIAGIAAIGALVAAASIGLVSLIIVRRKRAHARAHQAGLPDDIDRLSTSEVSETDAKTLRAPSPKKSATRGKLDLV